MERFNNFISMLIEAIIIGIIYLIILPVRVLSSIGNRLVSNR